MAFRNSPFLFEPPEALPVFNKDMSTQRTVGPCINFREFPSPEGSSFRVSWYFAFFDFYGVLFDPPLWLPVSKHSIPVALNIFVLRSEIVCFYCGTINKNTAVSES